MMCPPLLLFMSAITSFMTRIVPKTLVSKTLFISSIEMHSTGPTMPIPALLTFWRRKQRNDKGCNWCLFRFSPAVKGTACWGKVLLLRTSTCRSLMPSIHCLMDSSLQTSSTAKESVSPYASPAASTSLSLRARSRIVAITVDSWETRELWIFIYWIVFVLKHLDQMSLLEGPRNSTTFVLR